MTLITMILDSILDLVLNSIILTSIAFAAFSVMVYLILTRVKNERFQLILGIGMGFFLIATPVSPAGGFLGSALFVAGTALVMISPVIAFRGFLNKNDVLPAVFLVALAYPAYFRTTQYMCDYYYPNIWNLGDFIGPLILALSGTGFLIFIRRYFESFKHDKRLLIPLLLFFPGFLWFSVSVAAASLSALMLISLNEVQKGVHKISDFFVLAGLILAAFFIFLPWPFLASLPCVLNIFPLWILPALAVSLLSAAIVYCLGEKIPEKLNEISAFISGFVISVILLHFSIWLL